LVVVPTVHHRDSTSANRRLTPVEPLPATAPAAKGWRYSGALRPIRGLVPAARLACWVGTVRRGPVLHPDKDVAADEALSRQHLNHRHGRTIRPEPLYEMRPERLYPWPRFFNSRRNFHTCCATNFFKRGEKGFQHPANSGRECVNTQAAGGLFHCTSLGPCWSRRRRHAASGRRFEGRASFWVRQRASAGITAKRGRATLRLQRVIRNDD